MLPAARHQLCTSGTAPRRLHALMKNRVLKWSPTLGRSIHASVQSQALPLDSDKAFTEGSRPLLTVDDIAPLYSSTTTSSNASLPIEPVHTDEPRKTEPRNESTKAILQALPDYSAHLTQICATMQGLGSESKATKQQMHMNMSKIRIDLKDIEDKINSVHRFLQSSPASAASKKFDGKSTKTEMAADLISTVSTTSQSHNQLFGIPISRDKYWQKIPRWKDTTQDQWMNYEWHRTNTVQDLYKKHGLIGFLEENLPALISPKAELPHIQTRKDFIEDVIKGFQSKSGMSIRISPHMLSMADWNSPLTDPIILQFVPMLSKFVDSHPRAKLDPLEERRDSPVEGLTHRYPHKALFLSTSVCEIYCGHCTRLYTVGLDTGILEKKVLRPSKLRWEDIFKCIEQTPDIHDVVVSGGDTYMLNAEQVLFIGKRLLSIPHVSRIRFATRGLAASPTRIVDPHDRWTESIIEVSQFAHQLQKQFAVHTQFNHPNESSWVTLEAAAKLLHFHVKVRNQTVLGSGVNDSFSVMSELQNMLDRVQFDPYYVFQCDMTDHVEHFRTPLQTILDLDKQFQGTMGGMAVPRFVVDLPGGGGKIDVAKYISYNRETGLSTFEAPDYQTKNGTKIYEYFDPLHTLPGAQKESKIDPRPLVLPSRYANNIGDMRKAMAAKGVS